MHLRPAEKKIDYAQGFVLGRPRPFEDVAALEPAPAFT